MKKKNSAIQEGYTKRGGVNPDPTYPKPDVQPSGQGAESSSEPSVDSKGEMEASQGVQTEVPFSMRKTVEAMEATLRRYPTLTDPSVSLRPHSSGDAADRLRDAFAPLPAAGVFASADELYRALVALEMCLFTFQDLWPQTVLAQALIEQAETWWAWNPIGGQERWVNSVCHCEAYRRNVSIRRHRHGCLLRMD